MNLLSQDYIGKTGTLLLLIFGLVIYLIFKIKLSPESIHNFIENSKKEIESKITATAEKSSETTAAIDPLPIPSLVDENEEELEGIHLKSTTSQFEINKEALKPTISHSSEIDLNPLSKPIPVEKTLPVAVANEDFVIETAAEEEVIEEVIIKKSNNNNKLTTQEKFKLAEQSAEDRLKESLKEDRISYLLNQIGAKL
jgi:S-DNA-T family DNA segregation ATPase FtsK/SpoIIIE